MNQTPDTPEVPVSTDQHANLPAGPILPHGPMLPDGPMLPADKVRIAEDIALGRTAHAGHVPGSGMSSTADSTPMLGLIARGYFGGLLMGIANIVPGISGGAMLLLVGMYTRFITAIANMVSFRWSFRSIATIGSIGAGAITSILFFAGIVKYLVVYHRLETFAVFIGMRLGSLPVVWRMARPTTTSTWVGASVGLVVTGAMAIFVYQPQIISDLGLSGPPMFFAAGLAGASATILPGMDGSYIMMLLGQYVPILGAIDRFKDAVGAQDWAAAWSAFVTLLPVAIGVALGLGGVSLLLKHLLTRYPKFIFGLLLGIIVGALIGLWPFGRYVPPEIGEAIRGVTVTAESRATIPADDWRVEFYAPTTKEVFLALGLILAGFVAAILLAKLEPKDEGSLHEVNTK